MNKTQFQPTRKCTICGQEKPLMAFLQQGGTYGQICAICKTNQGAKDDSDDSGSTSKGLKIDSKARLLAELDQKTLLKEKKESSIEILEKKDLLAEEKKQKKESTTSAEKKHRENYIDIKKTLTNAPNKRDESTTKKITETTQLINRQQEQETIQHKQTAEEQHRSHSIIDFTAPFFDPQIAMAKFSSTDFLRFKHWLGSSAPLGQKPGQSNQPTSNEPTAQKKHPPEWTKTFENLYRSTTTAAQTASEKAQEKGSTAIEKIEQTFGPSSRKR